jgi:hypothetical protein
MTPAVFCAAIRTQLVNSSGDEASVRGARGLCELYGAATTDRFDLILEQTSRGSPGSALAEGARWLLPRWRSAQQAKS